MLMLFALLPLAGWAQTAEFGDMALGFYTYGDATFPEPVVKDNDGAILTVGTHYTVTAGAFKDEACTQAITTDVADRKTMKADGTKYWRKVEGKVGSAYEGQVAKAWFTVNKAKLNVAYEAGELNRGFGVAPIALDATKFHAVAAAAPYDGLQFNDKFNDDSADDVKKGSAPTGYSTADNNAGTGKEVTFVGGWTADNYEITYTATLNIAPKNVGTGSLTEATISAEQGDVVYTGNDIIGVYTIKDGDKTLTAGTPAVPYTDYNEYNTINGTALTSGEYDALDAAQKIKTPATGDYWVFPVKNVDGTASDAKCGWNGDAEAKNYKPLITFVNNYSGTMSPATAFKVTPAPITVSLKDPIHVTYDGSNWKDHNFVDDAVLYTTLAEYNADHDPDIDQATFDGLTDDERIKTPATLAATDFMYSGIVGGDVANATAIKAAFNKPTSVAHTAGAATDVKTGANNSYALVISGGDTNGNANYKFNSYLDGALIIDPAELVIKAANREKTIGQADPTDWTIVAPANLVAGQKVVDVEFTRYQAGTEAGEAFGVYDITTNSANAKVKSNDGKKDYTHNYTFTDSDVKGTLTIKKGDIVVTILDAEKFYGEEDPELKWMVTGCDKSEVTVNINRAPGEPAGNYALTAEVENPDPSKYASLTVAPAILTIKKAQLTFVMQPQNVVKDDTKTKLSKDKVTVTGINNSDDDKTLYDLDFNTTVTAIAAGVITAADETVADGVKATLTDAAKLNYEIIGANAVPAVAPTTPFVATGKLIVNDGTPTGAPIEVASNNDAYTTLAAHSGEAQKIKINFNLRNRQINATADVRTWAKDNWNALVLPFDITVAELSARLGYGVGGYNYVVVNTVKKDSPAGKFQFQYFTGTIPANTPFMVKTVGNITTTDATEALTVTGVIDFGTKTIDVPAIKNPSVELDNGYKLVGQYENFLIDKNMPMNAKNEGLYRFQFGDNDEKFRTFGPTSANTWTIVPFDCYVDLSADAAAHEVIFEFEEADGTITSIKSVAAEADKACANKEGWYTINGVKLQNAPSQKGIYIFNGKKLVVK